MVVLQIAGILAILASSLRRRFGCPGQAHARRRQLARGVLEQRSGKTCRARSAQITLDVEDVGDLAILNLELGRRGVRRCRSYWLCGLGGLVLGLATGLFGRRAISATTAAVERVVLAHLKEQLSALGGQDVAAATAIAKIVAEEQEHLAQSSSHFDATQAWSRILSPIVAIATESLIWLGMRL